jgi:hypothetical protein
MPWTVGDVDHIPHDPLLMSKKITIIHDHDRPHAVRHPQRRPRRAHVFSPIWP